MRNKNKHCSNGKRNLKHLPYGYLGGSDYNRDCWFLCISKSGYRQKQKNQLKQEVTEYELITE